MGYGWHLLWKWFGISRDKDLSPTRFWTMVGTAEYLQEQENAAYEGATDGQTSTNTPPVSSKNTVSVRSKCQLKKQR